MTRPKDGSIYRGQTFLAGEQGAREHAARTVGVWEGELWQAKGKLPRRIAAPVIAALSLALAGGVIVLSFVAWPS